MMNSLKMNLYLQNMKYIWHHFLCLGLLLYLSILASLSGDPDICLLFFPDGCYCQGAGKSAVLNSLIGHPVLVSSTRFVLFVTKLKLYFYSKVNFLFSFQPTGENGATRAPISIDLQRDASLSSKSIILQIDNKSQQVSAS